MFTLNGTWGDLLNPWLSSPEGLALHAKVQAEYDAGPCWPTMPNLFNAINSVDLPRVKAVVIGQDPYPQAEVACGYAFATQKPGLMPQSLDSIVRELYRCYNRMPPGASLQGWVNQGVLLLNPVLSVKQDESDSHAKLGWQTLTSQIIELTLAESRPIAWLVFGAPAGKLMSKFWVPDEHKIFRTTHPSPRSAYKAAGDVPALYGSNVFKDVDAFFDQAGVPGIDWTL